VLEVNYLMIILFCCQLFFSPCDLSDTAQMITAGCSFTFDGLKQTILKVNEKVQVRKVQQLTKNYRMSKGVLDVANAILAVLKNNFPHAIEYAPPEVAMKDIGLRVVLLNLNDAKKYLRQNKVQLGTEVR